MRKLQRDQKRSIIDFIKSSAKRLAAGRFNTSPLIPHFLFDLLARGHSLTTKSFEAVALQRGGQRLHLLPRGDKKQSDNLAVLVLRHAHAIL
jgi:hypothetical protein